MTQLPHLLYGFLAAALTCLACGRASLGQPSIEGRWEGALQLGLARQPLIIDVRAVRDGYQVVITLPTQWRIDSTARVRQTGDDVELVLGQGPERLALVGTLMGDSLAMLPRGVVGAPRLLLRRRGPVPPPTIRTETVTVQSTVGPLQAWLVLPAAPGPHPAIVLVHGSGQASRDALLPLARQFAEHGVAALAHDKRRITIVRDEELTPGEDLAADALSAVDVLARRADVRGDRIGLWGGSQGSGVGALAASRSSRVAFVVSVAGGGTAYTPFVLYQIEHRLRARGHSPAVVAEALQMVRARHDYLRGLGDSSSLAARFVAARVRLAGTGVPLDIPTTAEREMWERAGYLRGDAAAVWRSVQVPVLAIWGGRDRVVPPRASAIAVAAALATGGNRSSIVCLIAEADHGMQLPSGPGAAADGGFAFPGLAPAYRHGMFEWVREQVGFASSGLGASALRSDGCVAPLDARTVKEP